MNKTQLFKLLCNIQSNVYKGNNYRIYVGDDKRGKSLIVCETDNNVQLEICFKKKFLFFYQMEIFIDDIFIKKYHLNKWCYNQIVEAINEKLKKEKRDLITKTIKALNL